ncbi:unnamed protein product [Musa acuminata subsp. burmannicoides]
MPPAMVDFGSRPAPSSPLRNPSKGEISASGSPSFHLRSGIPSSGGSNSSSVFGFPHRSVLGQQPPASRGLKNADFVGKFAAPVPPVPFPPIHPVPVPGRPLSAAGLSKPRLVKVRKHLASPRVRSAATTNANDGSGFNPFHSGPVGMESDISGRHQRDGVQGLDEKFHGRNPLESEAGSKIPEHSSSGSLKSAKPGSAGFVMSDGGAFVFGSSEKKGSNLGRSKGKKFVKSENTGYGSDNSMKNVASANVVEETFSFSRFSNRSSDDGLYVFGSGMKNFSSEQGPPADLSDQNVRNLASIKSQSDGFVFGTTSVMNLGKEDDGSGNNPVHKPHSDACIFQSDLKQSSNSCENSSENLSGRNNGIFEFGKSESAAFVFGTDSVLLSGVKNIGSSSIHGGPSSFVDGNTGRGIFSSEGVQSKSDNSSGNEDSRLKNSGSIRSECYFFGASISSNFGSKDNGTKDVINNVISEGGREPNVGSSVCGNATSLNSNLGQESFIALDVGTVSRLHVEMRKLNLQRPDNEVEPEKAKQADCRAKINEGNTFVFGRSQSYLNSSGATDCSKLREAGTPFVSSLSGHDTQSVASGLNFASVCEEQKLPHMEFTTPIHVTPVLSKESLFTGPHENKEFNVKRESRTTRKKRREKSRQSVPLHKDFSKTFASVEKVVETVEKFSSGGYSPMDYSPYDEISDESRHIFSSCESIGTKESVPVGERKEDPVSATQHLYINKDGVTLREHENSGSRDYIERDSVDKSSFIGEQITENGREKYFFKSDNMDRTLTSNAAGMKAETESCSSNFEPQANENENCFNLNSSLESFPGSDFTFGELAFNQGLLSAEKRQHRKKSRMRSSKNLNNSIPKVSVPMVPPSENLLPDANSVQPVAERDFKGKLSVPQNGDDVVAERQKKLEKRKDPISTIGATATEQEVCNQWRLRGNQAYSNGDMSKAEDFYTRGLNSISITEVSRSDNKALMLCYSNRAAARMSLGRMREALSDCMMAAKIDPSFLRAQVRAACCHLALGEIEDALKHFKNCLQSKNEGSLDHKILVEASDGLLKTQQVADYMVQSEELMLKKSSNEAAKALQIIIEALFICPYSERLMERKAEAFLMLRRYKEVIVFCEQTIEIAERNYALCRVSTDNSEDMQSCPMRLWRLNLMSKSYFYLGRFEEAVELLKKHEKVTYKEDKNVNGSSESLASLCGTINELLRLKAAGNAAFQAGRHLDAVEHYSAALACNTESRPFTAICFCNRAAAYQALGQITDAIADCSIAIALVASYAKAISRRATLHEMIRDYGQAANDLRRLISLLKNQSKDKDSQAGVLGINSGNNDLNQAHVRLCSVEEEARKETPLDLYMILGIEVSSSAADVKKAYRKAALRHHPDKAGQLLARNETIDDGFWREVADEVHKDADRLFKMIGEAYTVLSDATKRLQYDAEEELRTTLRKTCGGRCTSKTQDNHSSPSERRRWRAYASTHQRWSESSRYYK